MCVLQIYNKLPSEKYIYLLLYMEDVLIASKSKSAIDKLKKELSFELEKSLRETRKVVGMEIELDWKGDKVSLMQKGYLKKVPQKFNINDDTKSVSTSLAPHFS